MITDTAITTAPAVLDARNAAFLEFSGTVATTAVMMARGGGSAVDTVNAVFGAGYSSAAGGIAPNVIPATNFQIALERDGVFASAKALNSAAAGSATSVIDRSIPGPTRSYKVAVIVENTSAPASSTDFRLHMVNLLDSVRFDVAPRNAGSGDATRSWPVIGNVGITGTANILSASANEDAVLAAQTAPHIVGGVARTANTAATIITGDAVRQTMTLEGAAVNHPYAVPELAWVSSVGLTGTTAVAVQSAGGAGLKRHVTSIWALSTCASATDLIVLDGSTERVRYTLIPNVPTPILLPTPLPVTANTALNASLSAACTVRANFTGYTAK